MTTAQQVRSVLSYLSHVFSLPLPIRGRRPAGSVLVAAVVGGATGVLAWETLSPDGLAVFIVAWLIVFALIERRITRDEIARTVHR